MIDFYVLCKEYEQAEYEEYILNYYTGAAEIRQRPLVNTSGILFPRRFNLVGGMMTEVYPFRTISSE